MAIVFPQNPTIGQRFTTSTNVYIWTGKTWKSSTISYLDSIEDVDVTTVSPTLNSVLKYNGTKWATGSEQPLLTGTLEARPLTLSSNGYYLVSGDSSTTNNGKLYMYNTVSSSWIEVDTKISNRSIDDLSDVSASEVISGDTLVFNGTNWIPQASGASDASIYTGEPTGFPVDSTGAIDRSSSSISFNNSTRTFTITPVSTSFDVIIKGKKVTKTTESITIPNSTGTYHIYFNESGVIQYSPVFSLEIIYKYVYLANLYWSATQSKAIIFGDERHGSTMDSHTHAHLHTSIGAVYIGGCGLNTFVIDGNGSLNTHAQFGIDTGLIRDEDILHSLPARSSTTPIPVLYRIGGEWNSNLGSFNFKTNGSGRVQYNSGTSGSYALTEVTSGSFTLTHVVATNDPTQPFIALMGLNQYSNKLQAREGAMSEIGQYVDLPFMEFVFIGTVILQTSNSFTNTAKAIVVSTDLGGNYVDWRFSESINPVAALQEAASRTYIDSKFAGETSGGAVDYFRAPQLNISGTLDNSFINLKLDDLTDVVSSGAVTGNTIVFDGTKWIPQIPNINFLSDVDTATTGPTTGQSLLWNGTNWAPGNVSVVSSLAGLSDVNFTLGAQTNNYALGYNSSSSKWFAQPFVKTINGVVPTAAGDVVTPTITTGLLSARPTTGLVNGQIYIVSGETTVINRHLNGRNYVYSSASASWIELSTNHKEAPAPVRYVSPWGNDTTNTGAISSPYFSIAKAITDITTTGGTIYLYPGSYGSNITLNNSLISIIGMSSSNTSNVMQANINGVLRISGSCFRNRFENLSITAVSSVDKVPVIITSSSGQHEFKNVRITCYDNFSNAVLINTQMSDYINFIDCEFLGATVPTVELNAGTSTTVTAGPIYFEKVKGLGKLYVRSMFTSVTVKDTINLGITHEAGKIRLLNCQNINPFTSTATVSSGNGLYVENSSTYNSLTNTYGVVNKSGSAVYTFKNFDISKTGNTISGTETVSPDSNRYIKLNDLRDINFTVSPVDGDVISYDTVSGVWVPKQVTSSSFSQSSIGFTSPTPPAFASILPGTIWIQDSTLNQYIYVIDGDGDDVWISLGSNASSVSFLGDLLDVNTTGVQNNSTLIYNSGSSKWIIKNDSFVQESISFTSATPPAFSSVLPGTVWVDENSLDQYIYIKDGSGNNVWVSVGSGGGASSTLPSSQTVSSSSTLTVTISSWTNIVSLSSVEGISHINYNIRYNSTGNTVLRLRLYNQTTSSVLSGSEVRLGFNNIDSSYSGSFITSNIASSSNIVLQAFATGTSVNILSDSDGRTLINKIRIS